MELAILYVFVFGLQALCWLLAVVGLFAALPAGVACWLKARSRRLDAIGFGLKGAAYTIAFAFPLVLVVARLNDKRVPLVFVAASYVFLYTLWASLIYNAGRLKLASPRIIGDLGYWYSFLDAVGVPVMLASLLPPAIAVINHSRSSPPARPEAEWPYSIPYGMAYAYWFALYFHPGEWSWSRLVQVIA